MAGAIALTTTLASAAPQAGQGGVTSYCTPGVNGALVAATGSTSFAENGGAGDLVLHARGLPANTTGLFFYGDRQQAGVPFGGGELCVGSSTQLWRLAPVSTGAGQDAVELALDYLSPPDAAATILPGSTWHFQFWFRDGATSDLTDALAIDFVPPVPVAQVVELDYWHRSQHPLGQSFAGGVMVMNEPAEFDVFWDLHTFGIVPPPQQPSIDWNTTTVIAAFAGRRLTLGYWIEVLEVALDVTALHVTTEERQPGAGCGAIFSESNPLQIVGVRKVEAGSLREWAPTVTAVDCP